MNKIPCEVVRDLFPSYIDRLTSDITNRCIEEHVGSCEPCREILDAMRAPQETSEEPSDGTHKEIDFLKKNRRRNKRIIWGAIAAVICILAVVFITRYMIGEYRSDMTGDYYMWDAAIADDHLTLDGRVVDNIFKIVGISFREEDGVVTGEAKVVPSGMIARMLYPDSFHAEYTASGPIRQVSVNGRILWNEGEDVSMLASAVYQTRHDYVGDMSANAWTANTLSLANYLGFYQNELQTAEPPYGWTIRLMEDIPSRLQAIREADMESFGYVLLAAVGNLDSVTYAYTVDGRPASKTITSEDATAFLGQDIKDCMQDVNLLDELLRKCGLDHYVFGGAIQYTASAAPFAVPLFIHVVNNTDEDLKRVLTGIYIDEKLVESQGGENADGSSLDRGQLLSFTIEDVPGSASMLELEFTIETADGTIFEIPDRLRVPVSSHGMFHDIHITGNAQDGFRVNQ